MSLHLLIPAAGGGQRLGTMLPKALVPVGGRPLVSLALSAFEGIPFQSGIVMAPAGHEDSIAAAVGRRFPVRAGGSTRAESVAIGIAALDPGPRDYVVVHDAARPFVTPDEVRLVIAAAEESGAAIAVMTVADTLKRWDGEWISGTLDRREIAAAATPQVFRGDVLRRALEAPPATDEAARCEAVGIRVAAVPVSRRAFKITFPEDLAIAEAMVRG
ncbi:MAG TPA: 2-C-methyl-D-erythritol 4-phosphate cytidylyltransferase [Thermoanaerobaculia bacterium]|nr:2-C-methyl-D-erythritol 4-phosphate cytidylyltransferase [Thermoanaerobaculia bacterium]